MGTTKSDFVMIGYKLPKKIYNQDNFYEKFEKHIDRWGKGKKLRIVIEPMNNNFAIFGRVIAYGDEFEGLPLVKLMRTQQEILEIKKKAEELFGIKLIPENIHLYVFTIWS